MSSWDTVAGFETVLTAATEVEISPTTGAVTTMGSGAAGARAKAGAAADDEATDVTASGAATEGTTAGSSTTAFECFAARAPGALAEVLDPAFLVEGTAFADTTGSEGF